MKRAVPYVAAICVAALLAFVFVRLSSTGPSDTMPVFPPTAKNLPRVELADLVALVLPPKGFVNEDADVPLDGTVLHHMHVSRLGWDYLIHEPAIAWQTQGFEFDKVRNVIFRKGIARVSVGGKTATVVHQAVEELAWTIELATSGNPNFGPQEISIAPGVLPDDVCFGVTFTGCTFKVQQAIASVKSKLICGLPVPRALDQVYSISTADKDASLLVFHYEGGSGGEQTVLEIRPMSDQNTACDPDAH